MPVPRMRTAPQAYKEILIRDPDTAITLRAIRRMIAEGKIPSVRVGNKILINYDLLLDKLSCYNNDVVCVS